MRFSQPLPEDQLKLLRAARDRMRAARDELHTLAKAFSGEFRHSQACSVGGLSAGGVCSFAGESPCPCGADGEPMCGCNLNRTDGYHVRTCFKRGVSTKDDSVD